MPDYRELAPEYCGSCGEVTPCGCHVEPIKPIETETDDAF